MAQWVGRHPTKQKVTGLIPGQGTCLDFGLRLSDVSLSHPCSPPSLFSSLPLSQKSLYALNNGEDERLLAKEQETELTLDFIRNTGFQKKIEDMPSRILVNERDV